MRKVIFVLLISAILVTSAGLVMAKKDKCTTIQDGILVDSMGNLLTAGYNQYRYNYQGRISNQGIEEYCQQRNDIPEGKPGHWDYEACMEYFGGEPFELIMKWNDAWLSNKDCDGDGLLDRHYGFNSYIGSGAWLTNHQRGTYEMEDKKCNWVSFVKIIAKPTADYDCSAYGGSEIWGSFCIIMNVYNDQCGGYHGLEYKAEIPGFGYYQ